MTPATLDPVTTATPSAPRLVSLAEVQAAALVLGKEDRLVLLNQLAQSLPKYDFDEPPDDNSTELPPLSPRLDRRDRRGNRQIDPLRRGPERPPANAARIGPVSHHFS